MKLRNIIITIVVVLAFSALATCTYAADAPPAKQEKATVTKDPIKPAPTEKDLILQQRETILERMDKLDAQYNLAHSQYILAQQDLDRINAKLNDIIAAEKKGKKEDKKP